MSHPEQRAFCASVKNKFPKFFENHFVIDIGSLDINGSNKDFFSNCVYLGVDISKGKNVDIVSKGHELKLPNAVADVVISTECFEHDKYYQETFKKILSLLKPGGFLMFTCATTGRPEHGTSRTSPEDSPLTTQFNDWCDYYKNLTADDFTAFIDFEDIFESYSFSVNEDSHDLYFWGVKKGVLNVDFEQTFKMLENVDTSFFKDNTHIFSEYVKGQYFLNHYQSRLQQLNPKIVDGSIKAVSFQNIEDYMSYFLAKYASLFRENQNLEEELSTLKQNYQSILTINFWKISKPLQEIRRWKDLPKQQGRKYLQKLFFLMKKCYQALPLKCSTKLKIRIFFAKYLPKFLVFSGTEIELLGHKPRFFIDKSVSRKKCLEEIDAFQNLSSGNPLVSVIIPVYGNLDYTLKCILSILKNKPEVPFEIIVVDDCSPDESYDVLQQLTCIKLFKNHNNQGFIRTCNFGALKAQGEYLYFLNNDTQVTNGFLDELYQTFLNLPNTGLVGSKLIYPDGVLQEAGGILWQDGSAWNFGRGRDENLPCFNYAREVDYCSGASIMLPKVLFNLVGGFDEHYLPAYCEDSDLALKIRQLGYRVIYQPMSVIFHFEGVSSGVDVNQGVKSYQVENTKKLFNRWQTTLNEYQVNGKNIDLAKDRRMKLRALVIDHCTPTPDQDAGSVTALNTMLLLREMDFQITFIPENNFLYSPKYTPALQKRGIEVLHLPYVSSVKAHLSKNGARYDLIVLIRPGVASKYLDMLKKLSPQAKLLYLPMDLHYLRMMREQAFYPEKIKQDAILSMQKQELEIVRRVDCSMIHSDVEMTELQKTNSNLKLDILPLIIDFKGRKNDFNSRKDLLFIGGFQHFPNVDAMVYFVKNVMPILREKLPGICLNIVGSHPTTEIQALSSSDVIVHGFVENIQSFLDKAKIAIAPLRYGAGVKGKVGVAMASGLPVVATSIAAEGMFLTDLENILIANSPELFAEQITKLYQDEQLWLQLSDNGLAFAKTSWSKEAVWIILSQIIAKMGFKIDKAKYPLSLC